MFRAFLILAAVFAATVCQAAAVEEIVIFKINTPGYYIVQAGKIVPFGTPTPDPTPIPTPDVLTDREPGEIILRYGQTWPATYDEPQAVTINYLAGIADTAAELGDKDEWIKEAILLLVQAFWLRDFGQVNGKIFERVDQILEAHRCGDDFFQYGEE